MRMVNGMIKIFWLYLIVIICISLFVLFPREPKIDLSGGWGGVIDYSYGFCLIDYKNNVVEYVNSMIDNKSLGPTKWKTRTVEDEIVKFFPKSLAIIILGFTLCLFFGVNKGIYDFHKSKTKSNILGSGSTWLFQSIPDFFIIICVIWLFTFYMPFSIMGDDDWYKFIAPGILVAITPTFYIARITSVSLLSTEKEPFIQVAASKGLTKKLILYHHMFKQCMITISNHLPSIMLFLITNLLVVEYLLGYEGAAYRLFSAIGYTNVISPGRNSARVDESGLIIGISICFLLLVMISHMIGQIVKFKLEPPK